MSKNVTKMYVLRLSQGEVASIVEALAVMAQSGIDGQHVEEVTLILALIQKILVQASKSE